MASTGSAHLFFTGLLVAMHQYIYTLSHSVCLLCLLLFYQQLEQNKRPTEMRQSFGHCNSERVTFELLSLQMNARYDLSTLQRMQSNAIIWCARNVYQNIGMAPWTHLIFMRMIGSCCIEHTQVRIFAIIIIFWKPKTTTSESILHQLYANYQLVIRLYGIHSYANMPSGICSIRFYHYPQNQAQTHTHTLNLTEKSPNSQ